nr:hypothetical protein [uncultured Desulfobacter sp.]
MTQPPSRSLDTAFKVVNKGEGEYKLTGKTKGVGRLDLYIWWYTKAGKATSEYVGRYFLPSDYKYFEQIFTLPPEAVEYRVAFFLQGQRESESEVFLDDIKIERPEEQLVKQATDTRNWISMIVNDCTNEFHTKNEKEQAKTNPHNGNSLNWTKLSSGSLLPVPYNPKENNVTQNKHTAYVKQAFERQSNFLSRIIPIMATKTKTIDTWLYSGSGRIETSPSCSFDYSTLAPFNNDAISEYRLAFLLRGSNNLTPAECYIDDVYFAYTLPAESDSLNTNKRRQLIRWDFKTDDPVTRWTASENTVNKLAIIDNEQGFLKYSAPSLSFLLSDFKTILGLGKKKRTRM